MPVLPWLDEGIALAGRRHRLDWTEASPWLDEGKTGIGCVIG